MVLDRQDVFTRALTHLRKQGGISTREGIGCAYRTAESGKLADGRACAVGALISDAAYNRVLEGNTASSRPVLDALRASGVAVPGPGSEDARFLGMLQSALHDQLVYGWRTDAEFREALELAAKTVAAHWKLTVPPVEATQS